MQKTYFYFPKRNSGVVYEKHTHYQIKHLNNLECREQEISAMALEILIILQI